MWNEGDGMREKLIELLRSVQYQGNAVHGYHDKYIQNRELADHLIANGVTIQRWIPVSEPPKEKGRYWCNVKSFSFPGSYYQTTLKWDDGFIEGSIYTDDVTHWMPLPLPPKEGE